METDEPEIAMQNTQLLIHFQEYLLLSVQNKISDDISSLACTFSLKGF